MHSDSLALLQEARRDLATQLEALRTTHAATLADTQSAAAQSAAQIAALSESHAESRAAVAEHRATAAALTQQLTQHTVTAESDVRSARDEASAARERAAGEIARFGAAEAAWKVAEGAWERKEAEWKMAVEASDGARQVALDRADAALQRVNELEAAVKTHDAALSQVRGLRKLPPDSSPAIKKCFSTVTDPNRVRVGAGSSIRQIDLTSKQCLSTRGTKI